MPLKQPTIRLLARFFTFAAAYLLSQECTKMQDFASEVQLFQEVATPDQPRAPPPKAGAPISFRHGYGPCYTYSGAVRYQIDRASKQASSAEGCHYSTAVASVRASWAITQNKQYFVYFATACNDQWPMTTCSSALHHGSASFIRVASLLPNCSSSSSNSGHVMTAVILTLLPHSPSFFVSVAFA